MKRKFFYILMVLIIISCSKDTLLGNQGIIISIEKADATYFGKRYSYKIEVSHNSLIHGGYYMYTNKKYNVGDTIRIQ